MLSPERPNIVNGVELSKGIKFFLREFFLLKIIDSILPFNGKKLLIFLTVFGFSERIQE